MRDTYATRTPVNSADELVEQLVQLAIDSPQPYVRIFGGHAPLRYAQEDGAMPTLDTQRWGAFSEHTFALSCKVMQGLRQQKPARFALIIDDIIEVPKREDGSRKYATRIKSARKRFYKEMGLPDAYREILREHGLLGPHASEGGVEDDLSDLFVLHERSFGSTPLISEAKLKLAAIEQGVQALNDCSMTYSSFLNDPALFSPADDFLVAFIPGQCRGNVCSGVLDQRTDLRAAHVFYPHIDRLGGLMENGNGYERISDPLPLDEYYADGRLSVVVT